MDNVGTALLAAATVNTGTSVDVFLPFVNFGLIGILIVMVLTKTGFVPKWALDTAEANARADVEDVEEAHQREVALLQIQIDQLRIDKAELRAANDRLTNVTQDQFLPALIESNRLIALYIETLARRGGRSRDG